MLVKLIIKISIIFFLFFDIGSACRYTVREIGFADFGKDIYQFVLLKDKNISEANAELFKNISNAALLDANITARVIDVYNDTSSAFLEFYKQSEDGKFANIVFTSPEGRTKSFQVDIKNDFTQSIWKLIEHIATSSVRDKIFENIIKSYAVIFFIEGTNSEDNIKARNIIERAVEEIKRQMTNLPKPVDIPPEIITIKPNQTENEEILLWSLGWDKADKAKPALALIYGRGRRMGPMLKDEFLREDIITNMLRFIGEDCECGLDRSWMLGMMIPARWESRLKAGVVERYGFDADNPMVISEMSQILSIAPERMNRSVDTGILYGYTESLQSISALAKQENIDQSLIDSPESIFGIRKALIITSFGFLALIIFGVIIFFRSKSS